MQLASYLFFKGTAAEAFDFYAKCLGGRITMKVTLGQMSCTTTLPAAQRDLIAHVRLVVGEAVLMGSDWCGPTPEPYPGIHGNAVSLTTPSAGDAERLFEALSEGGTIAMPIAETEWAQRFGMLIDRFGATWMVSCERAR